MVHTRGDFLFEPRDEQSGLTPDHTAVEWDRTRDRFQQRRLAGAIAADQRDALAAVDPEVHILEERQGTEGQAGALQVKDRHEDSERLTAHAPRATRRASAAARVAAPRTNGCVRVSAGRSARRFP